MQKREISIFGTIILATNFVILYNVVSDCSRLVFRYAQVFEWFCHLRNLVRSACILQELRYSMYQISPTVVESTLTVGIHIFHFDKSQSEHVAVNVFCMEEDTFDTLRVRSFSEYFYQHCQHAKRIRVDCFCTQRLSSNVRIASSSTHKRTCNEITSITLLLNL